MNRKASTLRETQHAATAEAMLDAAQRTLLRRGYQRATMQRLAAEAGCAAGTFYLYFQSKQGLFEALVARHVRGMHAAAREAMAGVRGPLEKVRQSVASILRYWQGNRPFLRLVLAVWPERHRAMRERLLAMGLKDQTDFRQSILGLLRQARRQGLVRRDLPAETLMDFLDAVGLGLVEVFSQSPRRRSVEEQARILWGLVAGGILHQEPP